MNSVVDNPLLKNIHSDFRSRILHKFPEISTCPHNNFLFLHKYLDIAPCKFFDIDIYKQLTLWLFERDKANRNLLQDYLNNHSTNFSRALMHLDEINDLPWYDDLLSSNDLERIRFIEQSVHPSYLRLNEGVFAPLLHLIAYFNRIDRRKNTNGLDIWNIVEEIKDGSLGDLTKAYLNIIRNGIAHGGITYFGSEIKYQDKKGNEESFNASTVIRLFDDLLDTCNAIAASIGVFLLSRMTEGYLLPQHILFEELRARTNTPYWQVDTCIPSLSMKGNQLIIYVRANTRDYNKVQLSAFQTGILAGILSPGFKRYFVSIQSKKALPGWAAFKGDKITSLIERGDFSIQDCADVIEEGFVFFVPKPKLPRTLSILNSFYITARMNIPLAIAEFQKNLNLTTIDVRNVSIHRNGCRVVLNGEAVILSSDKPLNQEDIYRSLRRIVRKATKKARKQLPSWNLNKYLPLGYFYVSIFRCHYRKRRLASFGLGSDLVCTIRIQRIKRIKAPDIYGSIIEKRGKYRIAWNKQWLEATKRESDK